MSFTEKFPVSASRLDTTFEIPELKELIKKRVNDLGESKYFIQHKITSTIEGEKFLKSFESWNVIARVREYSKNNPQKQNAMKTRLDEDCVGIKERPNTDSMCYETVAGVGIADATHRRVSCHGSDTIHRSSLAEVCSCSHH